VGTQEQFYNGELSGSNFNTFTYSSSYVSPYNPYARVPANSTGSAAFQSELPVSDFGGAYTSGSAGNGGTFTSVTTTGGTISNGNGQAFTMNNVVSQSLISLANYLMTFDLNVTATAGSFVGVSGFNMITIDGVPTSVRNGIAFGDSFGQVDTFLYGQGGLGYITGNKEVVTAAFTRNNLGVDDPYTLAAAVGTGLIVKAWK
jgi:hypothetical protein